MPARRVRVIAALTLLFPASLRADDAAQRVEELLAAACPAGGPGGVVAVARDGKLLALATRGVRDVERPDPITKDTRFGVASTSKMFTAACVFDLARSGKLSLDRVRKHVPELPACTDGVPPVPRREARRGRARELVRDRHALAGRSGRRSLP
jgi:CubicO group peptidase (beta-lactamase class C family)